MRILGIVCEYNPFHTGHAYHMQEAKKQCEPDFAVGIMSGCFVQRAEPAIVSPYVRAKAAITNGLDGIIELPTVFSCASGNIFAEGAIRIFSRLDGEKFLAMGTEDDGDLLRHIADIQSDKSPEFSSAVKKNLADGLPYAQAVSKATAEICKDIPARKCSEILHKPNNILAIEYLKAINKFGYDIKPIFVARRGNGHNDISHSGDFVSSTAIRTLLQEKNYDILRNYVPQNFSDELICEYENHSPDRVAYNALLVNALRTSDISLAADAGEGLEFKLSKTAEKYCSIEKILSETKSKRYTMSRLKRICLQTLLGIAKETMTKVSDACGKLIAIKKDCRDKIKTLQNVIIRNTDCPSNEISAIDKKAGSIYSLITNRDGNEFLTPKLVTI